MLQYSSTSLFLTSATIESWTSMKILASSLRSLTVLAVLIAPSKLTSLASDWISELIPLRT